MLRQHLAAPAAACSLLQLAFELDPNGDGKDPIVFPARSALVASAYAYGAASSGGEIPNNNDLALIWVGPNSGKEVGDIGGFNAYGWNGYGFSEQLSFDLGFPAAPANAMTTSVG